MAVICDEISMRVRARATESARACSDAMAELARDDPAWLAKQSLAEFVRQAWHVLEPETPLIWNWHLDAICAHLEAVSAGVIRRLIINVPPGHMKSLLVSVFWPAWQWLHSPAWRMIGASYGLDLAIRDATKARDLVESDWYRDTFTPDWGFSKSQNAKGFYQNTRRGMRVALSVGGKTTGFRGNAIVIDDPLNASDAWAESGKVRVETIRWLDKAMSSRLADPRTGAIVLIMQRLHDEDPTGHLLQKGTYELLCLPTYFDPKHAYRTCLADSDNPEWRKWGQDIRTIEGELLFPELFTKAVVETAEIDLGPLDFAGQHQQRPTPAAGNLFKADMLCQMIDDEPRFWPYPSSKIVSAYFSWDTAVKDKTTNDYTAGCIVLKCADGHVYIVPVYLRRAEIPEVLKVVAMEWAKWRVLLGDALRGARIEEGAGTAVLQFLRQLSVKQEKYTRGQDVPFDNWEPAEWDMVASSPPLVPLPYTSDRDKVSRAIGVLPFVAGRSARLVQTDWSQDWLSFLKGFPLASHDDAVDATVAGLEPYCGAYDGNKAIDEQKLAAAVADEEEDYDD